MFSEAYKNFCCVLHKFVVIFTSAEQVIGLVCLDDSETYE